MTEIKQLTPAQQKELSKKLEILRAVKEGRIKPEELAVQLTKRRLDWLNLNRDRLRTDLPLPESAYRLVLYEHMQVKPEEDIRIQMVGRNLLIAENRNFCPYLEACLELEMDTRFVCREIGEPSLREMFKAINPGLRFGRDYDKIRPYSDYCLEYLRLEETK